MYMCISEVGLKGKLKRKIQEAGFEIQDDDAIIKRIAAHHLASRADNTVKKYSSQSCAFKVFCEQRRSIYHHL